MKKQNPFLYFKFYLVGLLLLLYITTSETKGRESVVTENNFIFVTYVESVAALHDVYHLAESLRTFGGRFRNSPLRVYIPESVVIDDSVMVRKLQGIKAELNSSQTPDFARWFFYGGKPFAAAWAEAAISDKNTVLVFMDADTYILREPNTLDLPADISLAYCPVMHNRSGTLYNAPPNPFWSRIYEILKVHEEMLFPMVTPADKVKIKAYFHCGLMAVRPHQGIFRRWAKDFETLCRDSIIMNMCKEDLNNRIFLHQAALTGAILNLIDRREMTTFSDNYNYPIFFDKQYSAAREFNSLEEVVTLRCVVSPEKVGSNWYEKLVGPPEKIFWLKERLFK